MVSMGGTSDIIASQELGTRTVHTYCREDQGGSRRTKEDQGGLGRIRKNQGGSRRIRED